MKIGYIQTHPIFGDKEANFTQVQALTKEIRADLLVLPELFAVGYTFTSRFETHELAELPGEETTAFLIQLSKETGAVIVAGFAEAACEKVYNAAMMVDGDRIVDIYRKIHLFNKENLWFSPGKKPYSVHDVRGAHIGMMICYDWMFPEAARTLSLLGADIITHPANLVMPFCQKAMITRCIENRVYAVTANRIGQEERGEDKFHFTGCSQITAPDGDVLDSASSDMIQAKIIEVDVERARKKKINEYNDVIGDRQPEFYMR